MPVVRSVILAPEDAVLVVERRQNGQVQTIDRVATLIGLERLLIGTGRAIELTTPFIGLLIRDSHGIHIEIRRCPVEYQALDRIATMDRYQGIEVLTGSRNGFTTPMILSAVADGISILVVIALIDGQGQAIDAIGTSEGREAVEVNTRLVVVLIAVPYIGQILRADRSFFLEIVNRILVQGQFVDRVATRDCLEVIVVNTLVGIGLLAPEVTASGVERSVGLEEVSRIGFEDILYDTVATAYAQHRIADDTCVVEMLVAEGSAVRLAEGYMYLRVVGRLYGQSVTVNAVATVHGLAAIPIDAALVVVLAVPYMRQFALADDHAVGLIETLGDTNMQFVDGVATMNGAQAVEIRAGVVDTLAVPGVFIAVTEGHHLLEMIGGSPVQYQFEYRVATILRNQCIIVHTCLGILLATEVVLGVVAEDIGFLDEIGRHDGQGEAIYAVATDKGLQAVVVNAGLIEVFVVPDIRQVVLANGVRFIEVVNGVLMQCQLEDGVATVD